MKAHRTLLLFTLLVAAAFARGAEPLADPAAHQVIVPYDVSKPPGARQPDRYYLPYETFQKLWQTAKENRRPPLKLIDDKAPSGYLGVSYRGQMMEKNLVLKARLEVVTQKEWQRMFVPVTMGDKGEKGAPQGDLFIDGKAAAFMYPEASAPQTAAPMHVFIEKPGVHVIEFTVTLPPLLPGGTVSFGLPATLAGVLYLEAPAGEEWMVVNHKTYKAQTEAGGGRVYAILVNDVQSVPDPNRLVLFRPTRGLPRGEGPVPNATVSTQITVRRMIPEEVSFDVVMNFPGAARRSLNFTLDPNVRLTVVRVSKPLLGRTVNVESTFQQGREGDRNTVHVDLAHEVSDNVTLTLAGTRLPGLGNQSPLLLVDATRQKQRVMLMHEGDLKVKALPGPGQTLIEGGRPGKGTDSAAGPAVVMEGIYNTGAEQPLLYDAQPAETLDEAAVDYVFQLSEQKSELLAALSLKRKRGQWTRAQIGLPAGYEVQSVNGPALTQWQHVGAELFLHFDPALAGLDARIIVHLARTVDEAVTSWKIEPLRPVGFAKQSGRGLIAAHAATQVRLSDISQRQDIQEMDPTALDSTFTIAPPFEKKRGLKLEGLTWSVDVSLARQPVRFSADAIALVLVSDAGIRVSQQVVVVVDQGALRQVSVRLPATLPEAVVSGPLLREMRTRIDGTDRVYECSFQTDVLDRAALTFDHDLSLTSSFSVPLVKVADAQRLQRYFVLDNASAREAKVSESTALETVSRDVVPYLPEGLARPQFYRATSDASRLALAYTQLTTTEANTALVTLADITTVLRADGERWDTVVYSLVNRSLQFLPVILPEGAELISVSVSGEAVRADEEVQDGKRVRLIPLIHTQAGQRALSVRLIWRFQPRDWSKAKLDDPELVGLTVERTGWTVWTPPGYELVDFDGNMEEVDAEGKDLQKLEGMLSELGDVNRALASGKLEYKDAENAYKSASALAENINKVKEEVAKKNRMASRDGDEKPQLRKPAGEARADTQLKAEDLGKDVSKQKQLLEGNWNNYAEKRQVSAAAGEKPKGKPGAKTDWNFNSAAPQNVGQLKISSSNTFGDTAMNQGGQQVLNDNVAVNNGFLDKGGNGRIQLNGGTVAPAAADAPNAELPSLANAGTGSVTLGGNNTYSGVTTQNMQTQGMTQSGANALTSNARGNNLSQQFNDLNEPKVEVSPAKPAAPTISLNSLQTGTMVVDGFANRLTGIVAGNVGAGTIAGTGTMVPAPGVVLGGWATTVANPFGAVPASPVTTPIAAPKSSEPEASVSAVGGRSVTGVDSRVAAVLAEANSKPSSVGLYSSVDELKSFSAAQTLESLRPTGRRSLALDVPLEGEARHFSKLKDHAVLELKIDRPWEPRQTRSAWVLGIGLLVAVGWSRLQRRSA